MMQNISDQGQALVRYILPILVPIITKAWPWFYL